LQKNFFYYRSTKAEFGSKQNEIPRRASRLEASELLKISKKNFVVLVFCYYAHCAVQLINDSTQ